MRVNFDGNKIVEDFFCAKMQRWTRIGCIRIYWMK